jgi:hypothetical protein
MLKAIQVLRIHLSELEKVNELCKDFCARYISCLKVKLNSDNIFKSELDDSQSTDEQDDSVSIIYDENDEPNINSDFYNNDMYDDDNTSESDGFRRKNKRGILPKQATNIMKQWLFQHIVVNT